MTKTSSAATKSTPDRLYQVLLAPIVSEKATFLADKREQVLFKITPSATKPEVKAAVEMIFKVQVESVQILIQKGKKKRSGKISGRRSDVKKAFVSLAPGQEINFAAEAK